MDAEKKTIIKEAQAQLLEGQVWTKKPEEPMGGDVWPEEVVVVERASFLFGAVLTMAVRPGRKVGCAFPIRADLLVDTYTLTYDPINGNGSIQNELEDCKMALGSILARTTDEGIRRTAESVLHAKPTEAENLEQAIKVAESILEGSSDPA